MISHTDILYILDDIAARLPDIPHTQPLRFDKWLVSSAMQKSIRRGDVETALRCAVHLYHTDKVMLWRRIAVTALEDIAIGDVKTVCEVLALNGCGIQRKNMGDLRSALYAVKAMAKANKSRCITHAYMLAEYSPIYEDVRQAYAHYADDELAAIALDKREQLVSRIIALHYLGGVGRYRSETLLHRDHNFELAQEILTRLNAPYALVQTCLKNLKKISWNGVLIAPLVYEVLDSEHQVNHTTFNDTSVDGLPLYACDGLYTRLGKYCVKTWRMRCPDLKPYTLEQLGYGLFYVESDLLDKETSSAQLDKLKDASISASLLKRRIKRDHQDQFLKTLNNCLPILNDIRAQSLKTYRL